jgi:hypothetical protein
VVTFILSDSLSLSIVIITDCVPPALSVPPSLLIFVIQSLVFIISHSKGSGLSLNKPNERARSLVALPKSKLSISLPLSSTTFSAGGSFSICTSPFVVLPDSTTIKYPVKSV